MIGVRLCPDCLAQVKKAKAEARRRRRARSLPRRQAEEAQEVAEDILYAAAKSVAAGRASVVVRGSPVILCEVVEDGFRCQELGVDPDHVLGGSMRREVERLGAEGLQVMCRRHHELKTANTPTGRYWLNQAKAHALRIGARRLVPLIEKALAKYEAKHGEPHGR